MSDLQYNTGASLLQNVRSNVNEIMGGEADPAYAVGSTGSSSASSQGAAGLEGIMEQLSEILQQLTEMLGQGGESGAGSSGATGSGSAGSSASAAGESAMDPISGEGRIWGDPHFIGQDGGEYDVQGEAGKTYNLLSDKDFQMNGRFDQYGSSDDKTVVGAVGISAGSDQIEVGKDGTVTVNGDELKEGDSVELANGGKVEYNDGNVQIDSGEWSTNVQFAGSGDEAHLNIDVETDNAVSDGVKPHGLLGQTFDADSDARNGDKGGGVQGGGAIEGTNGVITERGDTEAIESYEVDGLYDRNFEDFNKFFNDAESATGSAGAEMSEELQRMMLSTFQLLAQGMMMMMQGQMNDASST